MSNKPSAVARVARELAASRGYLLRVLLACGLVAALFNKSIRTRYAVRYLDYPWDHFKAMVDVVSQLDLIRATVYALVPVAAILLFTPASRGKNSATVRRAGWLAAVVSLAAAAIPFAAVHWIRPPLAFRVTYLLACLLVGLNAAALIWVQRGLPWPRWARRVVKFGFPVLDVLMPMWVWADYRQTRGRLLALYRPLPVALILLAPFLPWLLAPENALALPTLSPAFRQIASGEYYQVAVDRSARRLVAVSQEGHRIQAYELNTGRLALENTLPERAELQAVVLARDSRRFIGVSVQQNRVWEFDADTLALLRETLIARGTKPGEFICCRTYLHPSAEGLYANCGTGLYRLGPDGDRLAVAAHREGLPGDIAFEEKHQRLVHAAWGLPLAALDPATFRVKQTLPVPPRPERMAVDTTTDRLFVAFPMEGRLLVVDLGKFAILQWVDVTPGISLVAVDENRRRLFLGGLSPLVEIRSLDDLSLMARLQAPAWQRWLAFDAVENRLFLTSKLHGLWEIDLARADRGQWFDRYDPFFTFLSWAVRALPFRRAWGWDHV